jgi:tetratricopeptide (TPR) repeat protein
MSEWKEEPNFYQILGVPEWAGKAKIKEAAARVGKQLKSEYDAANLTAAQRERIRVIETAFLTLTDDRKRREYDQRRMEPEWSRGEGLFRSGRTDKGSEPAPLHLRTNETVYRDGREHLRAGRYVEAAVCFRQLMRYDENNTFLLRQIASAYRHGGQTGLAVRALERAIELEPDDWESYLTLGKLHERRERLLSARRCFKLAYRLNPESPAVVTQYKRGSLVLERAARRAKSVLRTFAPDRKARSLRLSDGWITRNALVRVAATARQMARPKPNRQTLRYTGLL